ncbi:protein EFFECTOR OF TRANSCRIPTION 2-like [Syzygium oleosum]|uniref:protein EFFECTOR OF TRANSCRIPTION 2-like n=1 Tax=Syzygium oleosum TaxID=219896 RepID=UPI0024B9D983|nr:protein EFFECTOR OF TRANSCRIPTION 2-like [Syzygium oleosum]
MGGSSDSNVVAPRLKREDCPRTKHGSAFSTWKVLVGPTDWEDYSLGKEGATRYRVHNLPKSPGPGIYELGVAASRAKSGRAIAKLDPGFVVVVYLGQADCVKTRLQQYGRSGAHLGKCSSAACEIDCKTSSPTKQLGLFEEILSRGYPIVFRWASLNNKGDAQRAELSLLNTFDYAWNKGGNGSRRPGDIFQKLDEIASSTYHISSIATKLLPFRPRQVGIRIKGKLLPEQKDSFPQTGGESSYFSNGIFKFSKSRPRLVIKESHANDAAISGTSPANESFSPLCGVILDDGFPCTKPPVQGRKRCSDHKGMRIQASNSVSSRKGASNDIHDKLTMTLRDHTAEIQELGNTVEVFPRQANVKNDHGTICGVDFGDGNFCTRRPARGRVRCEQHKGMRVNQAKKKHVGS